jgi:hypothetical protein
MPALNILHLMCRGHEGVTKSVTNFAKGKFFPLSAFCIQSDAADLAKAAE